MKNAVALGTFDGVHIGHSEVLRLPEDYKKIAVTFLRPPRAVQGGKGIQLMSTSDKVRVLKKIGIDEVIMLDFESVCDMKAEEFLEFIYSQYNPSLISCGFNYRFGAGALGDTELLKRFCDEKNIILRCCEPVKAGEDIVSSTLIRGYLSEGKIEMAQELLSQPFSYTAEIISGDKRGRTIGYPTINQKYPENFAALRFGVYKTKVLICGQEFFGITNIGIRPTYKSDFIISETYIKDFSGDVYGQEARVTPLRFLREERKFSDLSELKRQIELDAML